MKIKLLVFLLFVAHIAFAQNVVFVRNTPKTSSLKLQKDNTNGLNADDNTNLVHIGLETGLSVSNIVYAHNSYFKGAKTGFNAGITFDIPVEFAFSFETAILYSQKGYFSETNLGNYTEQLNFIDVPLLFKSASPHGKVDFFVGPQLSFLASAKSTFDEGFTGSQDNYSYTAGRVFIDGVIGVNFNISQYFDIRARYAIDLNSTNYANAVIAKYHNQVYQVGVGFKFN